MERGRERERETWDIQNCLATCAGEVEREREREREREKEREREPVSLEHRAAPGGFPGAP